MEALAIENGVYALLTDGTTVEIRPAWNTLPPMTGLT